jgi:hypothetical protein
MICSVFVASSMLSCDVTSPRQLDLVQRRAMPQLKLNFTNLPIVERCLWDRLDEEQKRAIVETLARLLQKATATQNQERTND